MKSSPTQPAYSREQIADAILSRLDHASLRDAATQFTASRQTQFFVVDQLLPNEMADVIYSSFPQPSEMRERKTLREHKYVAAQMNRHDPQAEEALFAFHDPRVVGVVAQITGLQRLQADPQLYAGGISLMARGNFLNPHLDNSHNHDRSLYRVLNLLYYVSPGWDLESGGNLELWPNGVEREPLTVPSLYNRLVVMTTGPESWHSVSCVNRDDRRCCVSNYYFSVEPLGGASYFRVTSFRGRPEQPLRDLVLRFDGKLRQIVRKLRPQGVVKTSHLYQRNDDLNQ